MDFRFEFPRQAYLGRIIPKHKLLEQIKPNKRLKDVFSMEIEKIIWEYKLAPDTINIPAQGFVREIQIFKIVQKSLELSEEALNAIDSSIPSPIIFILEHRETFKYKAAYKRQSEADHTKWVTSSYFSSSVLKNSSGIKVMPISISLELLYESLIYHWIKLERFRDETIKELVSRYETINQKEKELSKLEKKLKNEKQFKYQVEINGLINKLKIEIKTLK